MKKPNDKIVCMVGESGSGKTFLQNILRERGWKILDSYTTRPPRYEGELGHTFVTQKEFDALRDDFVAYTKFDGYEYATTMKQLKESQFYVIDPAGIEFMKKYIGRDKFVVVYIYAQEQVRFERMAAERGEKHAIQRIHHDREKFREFIKNQEWDYVVNNGYNGIFSMAHSRVEMLENIYRKSNLED